MSVLHTYSPIPRPSYPPPPFLIDPKISHFLKPVSGLGLTVLHMHSDPHPHHPPLSPCTAMHTIELLLKVMRIWCLKLWCYSAPSLS
jgi:hypothetical protein